MNLPFAFPQWLAVALVVAVLLSLLFWRSAKVARLHMAAFVADEMIERLTSTFSRRRRIIKQVLIVCGVLLLLLALARPQWGHNWERAESRGVDVMIALDVSLSMLAEDIRPNRLERSKLAILDLLHQTRGDRVGLIAFAGSAFLQCPLTLDQSAFRQTLNALTTDTIPVGGTNLAAAFAEAKSYFESAENTRIVVVITDGEDLEASGIARARELADAGVRILTVGVGNPEGELIPIQGNDGQRDYLRDASGNFVRTALDELTLKQIAEIGQGMYTPLGNSGEGLRSVYNFIVSEFPPDERNESLQRIPIERFQWFVGFALLLLLIEPLLGNRRRKVSAGSSLVGLLIAVSMLLLPTQGSAASPREAFKILNKGDPAAALEMYDALLVESEDLRLHYNAGVAAYRAAQFERAIDLFTAALRSEDMSIQAMAFHNLGNARTARGLELLEKEPARTRDLWSAALEDFDNAAALDPALQGAARNHAELLQLVASNTFTLQLLADPDGAGKLEGAGSFFRGIEVPVAATAADGYRFGTWEGAEVADPEQAKTAVVLSADAVLTAKFAKTWNLVVESDDPTKGSAGESGTYAEGEAVTITAEAEEYFAFASWQSEGSAVADEKAAETTITLDQDSRVVASFVPAFKLSISVEPEIGGQAGPSGFFEEYSSVPIQAEPRGGFEWKNWVGDGILDKSQQQTSIALIGDRVAIAEMERVWNLVLIPLPEEGGNGTGGGNHPVGSSVEINAEPAEGFEFERWEGEGLADPLSAQTQVVVQSTEHNVFAVFRQTDQDGDDQQEDDQQDEQKDQQNQDQQNEDQQQEDQTDQDQQQDQAESDSQPEDSGEEPEQSQQQEEQQQSDESEGQDSAQEQPLDGSLSQEEAIQLLNALQEAERFLPAAEPEDGLQDPDSTGRNW